MNIAGLTVTFDPNCLETTDERLFPPSRHRSERIRKKLIRRHGGEYRKQPCMFRVGRDRLFAHPSFKSELERAIQAKNGGAT